LLKNPEPAAVKGADAPGLTLDSLAGGGIKSVRLGRLFLFSGGKCWATGGPVSFRSGKEVILMLELVVLKEIINEELGVAAVVVKG